MVRFRDAFITAFRRNWESAMSGLLQSVDPDGLLEYSVVFTDRALNHMSQSFQGVMRDISATLKQVYNAEAVVVVPPSAPPAPKVTRRPPRPSPGL